LKSMVRTLLWLKGKLREVYDEIRQEVVLKSRILPLIEEIKEILPFLDAERKSAVKQMIVQRLMLHM